MAQHTYLKIAAIVRLWRISPAEKAPREIKSEGEWDFQHCNLQSEKMFLDRSANFFHSCLLI
jgi:hypothetical protein